MTPGGIGGKLVGLATWFGLLLPIILVLLLLLIR